MNTLPLVALVGRPNVGKSTLFNRLIKKRVSITHDLPGVTRDSIFHEVQGDRLSYMLVDTGGIVPQSSDELELDIFEQVREAMGSADLILFVVDGRDGLHPQDEQVAQFLRQSGQKVLLVINKIDGPEQEEILSSEFFALGFAMQAVSAAHGFGIYSLRDAIEEALPEQALPEALPKEGVSAEDGVQAGRKIAFLGRPNAGKSSIINALVGKKRLIVSPQAGTTRDSVDVNIVQGGKTYTLVDTAGVRRKPKVTESLEYFSVVRAFQAAKRADVVVLVLDIVGGVVSQDKRLLAFLDTEKIPFIIVMNKIDLLTKDQLARARQEVVHDFAFCAHVPILYSSSITRAGLGGLIPLIEKLWQQCQVRIGTGELNRLVKLVMERHQPPVVKGRRGKIYYMTQAAAQPPTFVFFVNDEKLFAGTYVRYLENQLRKVFRLDKVPLRMVFRSSHNQK